MRRLIRSNAAPYYGLAHRRLTSGTVVINRNHDPIAFFQTDETDQCASPLAGIVEQVAERLVKIFSLSSKDVRRGRNDLDAEVSFGMQPLECADKPFGGCGDRRSRRRRRGGCGGTGVR
jgi:hypothetical protein